MAIQSVNIYNAAVAGISGGVSSGRPPDSHNTVSANIAAAAAAIDAAIGAISGGGSPAQAALVQSLCSSAFETRQTPTAVQADYAATAALIAAEYNAAKTGQSSQPVGTSKLVSVAFAATATPGAVNATVVDAAFIGGSAFLATIQRVGGPTTGTNTVDAIQGYAGDAIPSLIGAVTLVLSSSLGYGGGTEPVAIQVMR